MHRTRIGPGRPCLSPCTTDAGGRAALVAYPVSLAPVSADRQSAVLQRASDPLYNGGPAPALRLPSRENGGDGGGWEGEPTAIAPGQLA
ncbi:hypothetical protein C7E18_15015 [Stenotrophomonas maltophilia]|nr:hypothetical protein C7E18_15015 [Stenotrophomonas maltophilia]